MPSILPPVISTGSLEIANVNASAKTGKVEDAARQFESLLISQMLRSARDANGGSLSGEEQESENDTMMGVAEQQFAQLLSRQGGLGLTRLIVDGLHASPGAHDSKD
jgi:Rod binding domain-containing protein